MNIFFICAIYWEKNNKMYSQKIIEQKIIENFTILDEYLDFDDIKKLRILCKYIYDKLGQTIYNRAKFDYDDIKSYRMKFFGKIKHMYNVKNINPNIMCKFKGLETIEFHDKFTGKLANGHIAKYLPNGIKELKFGKYYRRAIDFLPKKLVKLDLSEIVNENIKIKKLPPNLNKLSLPQYYKNSANLNFHNLIELEINHIYNDAFYAPNLQILNMLGGARINPKISHPKIIILEGFAFGYQQNNDELFANYDIYQYIDDNLCQKIEPNEENIERWKTYKLVRKNNVDFDAFLPIKPYGTQSLYGAIWCRYLFENRKPENNREFPLQYSYAKIMWGPTTSSINNRKLARKLEKKSLVSQRKKSLILQRKREKRNHKSKNYMKKYKFSHR